MEQRYEEKWGPLKEQCGICLQTYEFNTENFRFCIPGEHIVCRHCMKTCELCHQRELCIVCAEKAQDRAGIRIPLHICGECAESLGNGNGSASSGEREEK